MAARRPHGLIYALLGLSLAVNLVGAGYFGYAGFDRKSPRTVDSTIDFVASRYSTTVEGAVRQKLEARRAEIAIALDEMKEARRDTRRAIRQQPLDKGRVETAFAASREKADKFQRLIQGAIVDALPDLPEKDRASIEKDD